MKTMAIDQIEEKRTISPEGSEHKGTFVAIFVALALLAIGEVYVLNGMSNLSRTLQDQQATARKELSAQMTDRISALEQSNARIIEALKDDIHQTSQRAGTTETQMRRERALLKKLETEQAQQTQAVKDELARKADQEQVGALSGAVTSTRSDLDETRKSLEATQKDLGMARSEFGTLIARNHDDIEYLRKLGERNYFEFTAVKNKPVKVAGVSLVLKKTNVKQHRFNLNMIADDMEIAKKDRTANEPIFFSVQGSRSFYELVVNQVQSGQVKGYVSTPKAVASEVASR
jgi:HAMP domain-containing protein